VTHRRLLREAFSFHAGVEVDTQGDCPSSSPSLARPDAAAAAGEAQRGLASHP
jgi:hypothetical protein